MKSILTLIKLQFKARVSLPKKRGVRFYIKWSLGLAAILALFGVFVFGYFLLARQFYHHDAQFNLTREFLIFTLLGFQILQTIFLIPSLVRTLDINNERELLLKLPVSHRQIFASKIIVAYLYEILFATVVLLPILVAFGIATDMHWGLMFYIPLILIFIPAIPFFIATLLVYPITKIVNLMRSRALITSLIYLIGLVGSIILYMEVLNRTMFAIIDSGSFQEQLHNNAESTRSTANIFFPQGLFANLIDDSRWYTSLWSFFAILGISAFLFTISYFVAGANYKKTFLDERVNKSGFERKGAFKPRHPLYASTKKDILNIFRSSNYTFQFMLLVIVTPIVIFFSNRVAMFSSAQSFRFSPLDQIDMAARMVFGISLFVMLVLIPLACSFAASNITREGWNIYHTKLIPQNFRRQLLIKTFITFVPILVAIIVSVVLLTIPYQPGFGIPPQYIAGLDAFYLFGVATLMTIGYITLGTYLDLRNPLCNQVGAGELTKTTSHINAIMVGGLIIGAVVGLLSIMGGYVELFDAIGQTFLANLAMVGQHINIILLVFSALFAIGGSLLLVLHGPKRYYNLEQ